MNQNQIPFEPAEWFPELDELQKSREMNMYGMTLHAPRWLRDTFGFSEEQSITVFDAWTEYKS